MDCPLKLLREAGGFLWDVSIFALSLSVFAIVPWLLNEDVILHFKILLMVAVGLFGGLYLIEILYHFFLFLARPFVESTILLWLLLWWLLFVSVYLIEAFYLLNFDDRFVLGFFYGLFTVTGLCMAIHLSGLHRFFPKKSRRP
jgi:hypothetical protein